VHEENRGCEDGIGSQDEYITIWLGIIRGPPTNGFLLELLEFLRLKELWKHCERQ
jgi:hypothetical protein